MHNMIETDIANYSAMVFARVVGSEKDLFQIDFAQFAEMLRLIHVHWCQRMLKRCGRAKYVYNIATSK